MNCTCSTDLKPLERNGHTASCNHDQRKALREAAKVKKYKPIRKVSKKMGKELQTYTKKKAAHLAKHPDCQIKLDVCTGKAVDIHHPKDRRQHLNDSKHFLSACRECHCKLHDVLSAKERREKGLLI